MRVFDQPRKQIDSILVAAHEPQEIEELCKVLGRLHCNPAIVRDGLTLWDLLFNQKISRPDLIILDLHLAKINGLALVQRMRTQPSTGGTPVMLMTNSAVEQHLMESFDLGICIAMPKPFTYAKLLYALPILGLPADSVFSTAAKH